MTDDGAVTGHVSHTKREGDDEDDGQPFWDNGHEDSNGHNELVDHDREQIALSVDDRLPEFNTDDNDGHQQCDEAKESTEGFQL